MSILAVVLGVLLVISAGFNAYFLLRSNHSRERRDYDARMLLHDLTAGAAIVKVTRIAPEDIMLRSPRDIR